MKLSDVSIKAVATAQSPEDAAKLFLAAATKGLTAVLADAISKAISSTAPAISTSPSIQGWENLIGGVQARLDWQSPAIMQATPMVQVACFSPYVGVPAANVHALGGFTIGVSVSGTF